MPARCRFRCSNRPTNGRFERLPATDDDADWMTLYDALFQDLDIEIVMRPGPLDGAEDASDATNASLRMGDYRPAAWFNWFLSAEPREHGSRP